MSDRAHKEVIFRQFDRWGWDERSYTSSTSYQYARIARSCDAWMVANRSRSIFSARFEDFKAFLFSCAPTARRRNQVRQALIAVVDYLVAEGYRTDNPCLHGGPDGKGLPRLKEPKNVPRALAAETAQLLWAEAKAEQPMVTVLVGLYLWGGLRLEEGRLLRWDQVDLVARLIYVEGKGRGRREGGGKQRPVPIHDELLWTLKRWRPQCPDAKWVCPSPRHEGRPVSRGWISLRLRDLGDQIGIHLHPHRLRGTIATAMLHSGANILGVKEFLGHENLITTQAYLLAFAGDAREAIERVDLERSQTEEAAGAN